MCKVKNYLLELSALSRLPAPGQTALPFQENIFLFEKVSAQPGRRRAGFNTSEFVSCHGGQIGYEPRGYFCSNAGRRIMVTG